MVFITAGLTLTWDVLKYELPDYIYVSNDRLTLTWDVLKFTLSTASASLYSD